MSGRGATSSSREKRGRGDWDQARACILDSAHLQGDVESRLRALDFFESTFGSYWPGWREQRPLATHFFESLNGASTCVELHEKLALFVGDEGRVDVVGQLKSAAHEQYAAALMVLDLASRARLAGIETKLLRARGKRIADLRLHLNGRWVTIECLAFQETEVMKTALQVIRETSRQLTAHGCDALGRTTITLLGQPAPKTVLARMTELVAGAMNAIESPGGSAAIQGFATIRFERNLSPLRTPIFGVGGEPLTRDLERLGLRLTDKQHQLTADAPGIVVVRTRHLAAMSDDRPAAVDALLAEAERKLVNLPNIAGVLVYENWLAWPPLPSWDGCSDRRRAMLGTDRRGCSFARAIVANATAIDPLSAEDLAQFVGPAAFW